VPHGRTPLTTTGTSTKSRATWPRSKCAGSPSSIAVNRDKRLVGIVAIGDIAAAEDPQIVGDAVASISEPTH